MKYLFTLITFLFSYFSFGQNMVPNGDFEQYNLCPDQMNQLSRCEGWHTANQASPDYFNSCAINQGVPQNNLGYQMAFNGNGYAGILTYFYANLPWKEYLLREINTLEVGTTYDVSIMVSSADYSQYATKGISIYFFVDSIGCDTSHVGKLNVMPQIDFSNYGLITDTTNWVTFATTFTTDSAYKHIVIGTFKDTGGLQLTHVYPQSALNSAYYFIDNVVVQKSQSQGIKQSIQLIKASISPNPFTSSTTLIFNNPQHKKHTFTVYNIEGRLLQKQDNITTSELIIQRNNLSSGCYFYELKSEDGAAAKGKLFVQ